MLSANDSDGGRCLIVARVSELGFSSVLRHRVCLSLHDLVLG